MAAGSPFRGGSRSAAEKSDRRGEPQMQALQTSWSVAAAAIFCGPPKRAFSAGRSAALSGLQWDGAHAASSKRDLAQAAASSRLQVSDFSPSVSFLFFLGPVFGISPFIQPPDSLF